MTFCADGSSVTVNSQGATVTSWQVDGRELLFMSPGSVFDGHSEVYGGIPIIFPRLGGWGEGKPFHGFARYMNWEFVTEPAEKGSTNAITLTLESNQETEIIYPGNFCLTLAINLTRTELKMELVVSNVGVTPIEFTTLFHNYFNVDDIGDVKLIGLTDTPYRDAAENWQTKTEVSGPVVFTGPNDKVYEHTALFHEIVSPLFGISIEKSSSLQNTVVWTPWDSFPHFTKFLCVEPGNVLPRKTLPEGQSFLASQSLRYSKF